MHSLHIGLYLDFWIDFKKYLFQASLNVQEIIQHPLPTVPFHLRDYLVNDRENSKFCLVIWYPAQLATLI